MLARRFQMFARVVSMLSLLLVSVMPVAYAQSSAPRVNPRWIAW